MEDKIKVSVYCLAYNHKEYIRDTLDGFVMQKTNFQYEVFVHDDASTDNTVQIIDEYAQKYPNIIKPIYQSENQYSKGISISKKIIFPLMSGEYIAICEGDDYWCDKEKLQKQVDFLESHKEYSACVHNTRQINCISGETSYLNSMEEDIDLEFKKVVKKGNAQFQISSVLCRREFFYVPDEIAGRGFGDYPLAIYLMLKGKVRYLKDVMSVYRLFSKGSWTSKHHLNANLDIQIRTQKNVVDFLKRLLQYCEINNIESEYITEIAQVKRIEEVNLLLRENKGKEIINNYIDVYNVLPIKDKIKVRMPLLRGLIRRIKLLRG